MKMVNPTGVAVISAILFTTILSFCAVDGASGTTHELSYYYFLPASKSTASYSDCGGGSIGECLKNEEYDEEEWLMDSESNRRMLFRKRYISYGALNRNRIPCNRRGASYYNCRPRGPANPYTRGCSAITRCRS